MTDTHIKPGMRDVGGQGHIIRAEGFIERAAVTHQDPLRPDGAVGPAKHKRRRTATETLNTHHNLQTHLTLKARLNDHIDES